MGTGEWTVHATNPLSSGVQFGQQSSSESAVLLEQQFKKICG